MNAKTIFIFAIIVVIFSKCKKEETDSVIPEIRFPVHINALEDVENSVFEFPVILDRTTDRIVTVDYETKHIDASEGEDFVASTGTLTFPAGSSSQTITVQIIVDEFLEEDEQFKVILSSAVNATIKDDYQEAIGTILNDDSIIEVSAGGYISADSYPGRTLVWSDEFNEDAIDMQNWTYDLGGGGWGNQELQNYTSSSANSYVANGNLMVVAQKNGAQYTSARLKSIDLQEFQYGRIDIRALLPVDQGIWPALWMLGANFPSVGWPACGEIDIMELIGSAPNVVHGTVHFGNSWTQHQFIGNSTYIPYPQTFANEFHVFSIDWDENGITWYMDDQEFFSIDQDVTSSQNYPFDNEFFFIMNVAVGGQWPGYPDETTSFPKFMAVDYVRVFQ